MVSTGDARLRSCSALSSSSLQRPRRIACTPAPIPALPHSVPAMFFLLSRKESVALAPKCFGRGLRSEVEAALRAKVEGKCSGKYGFTSQSRRRSTRTEEQLPGEPAASEREAGRELLQAWQTNEQSPQKNGMQRADRFSVCLRLSSIAPVQSSSQTWRR